MFYKIIAASGMVS